MSLTYFGDTPKGFSSRVCSSQLTSLKTPFGRSFDCTYSVRRPCVGMDFKTKEQIKNGRGGLTLEFPSLERKESVVVGIGSQTRVSFVNYLGTMSSPTVHGWTKVTVYDYWIVIR